MFSQQENLSQQRLAERQDLRKRYLPILEIAREAFKDTAVTQNKEWSQKDVDAARQFLVKAAPYSHPKVFPSLWDHMLISSIYARFLAKDLGNTQINPFEAEVMGLIHDDGRLIVPNHYLRNDIALGLAENYAGMRKDFQVKFFPMEKVLGRHGSVKSVNDLTLPQILIDVSDNIGKRNAEGKFFTPEDVLKYGREQLKRNKQVYNDRKEPLWQSESFGWSALSSGKQELAINLLDQEVEHLGRLVLKKMPLLKRSWIVLGGKQNKFTRNYFENLRERVKNEFEKSENQEWLSKVKEAKKILE